MTAIRIPILFRANGARGQDAVHESSVRSCAVRLGGLAAVCLLVNLTTGLAAEPVLSLAMVRQPPPRRPLSPKPPTLAARVEPSALAGEPAWGRLALSPLSPERFSSTTIRLSQASETRRGSPIEFARRNPDRESNWRGWASARLEAGYGAPFDDPPSPLYGRNGTATEEPSYGYLKIRFTF